LTEDIFSSEEFKWLQTHPEIEEHINDSLEDSLNTNPLDSGDPDLVPYKRAVMAAHITIEVAQKKIIAGPYNDIHWQIIYDHLADFPSLKDKEKAFWQLFSFECAKSKEEDESWPNERIYMEAMKEMIRVVDEGSFEFIETDNMQVANLNSGTIQQIKGKGVNAKFVD